MAASSIRGYSSEIHGLFDGDEKMNVLALGAHYDDVELGCGGTVIKHVDSGDDVIVLVASNSGFAKPDGEMVRASETALREGREAARLMGAELISLDYETFHVPFDEPLTKAISEIIESRGIDTIYSHWTGDAHRDHSNLARCALMAGRHAPRFLMYRSNVYDSDATFKGGFYSDISAQFDRKLEAIRAHASEIERVQGRWIDLFTQINRIDGHRVGVLYAECFDVVRYLA